MVALTIYDEQIDVDAFGLQMRKWAELRNYLEAAGKRVWWDLRLLQNGWLLCYSEATKMMSLPESSKRFVDIRGVEVRDSGYCDNVLITKEGGFVYKNGEAMSWEQVIDKELRDLSR